MTKMTLKEVGGWYPLIKSLVQQYDRETALVYGVVWGFANMRDTTCWASQQTIADEAGMSVSTVYRKLIVLVDNGYLVAGKQLGNVTHYAVTDKIRIKIDFVETPICAVAETPITETEGSVTKTEEGTSERPTIKRVNKINYKSVTQHTPEENLYFSVTKQWPRKAQREVVIDLIKASAASYDELLRGYKAWVGKGWSPYNLDWIKYSKTGIPAYQKPVPVDHDREGYV
jgi:hypothetical protein